MSKTFGDFYRQNYGLVLSTIQRRVHLSTDAEDLTAEVFRIAWQKDATGLSITLPWLYRVVRNVIGNEFRRLQRSRNLLDKVTQDARATTPSNGDGSADVRAQIGHLPMKDQEILYLAYWDDLTSEEIAAILGCSASTARVRLLRARAKLAALLEAAQEKEGAAHG